MSSRQLPYPQMTGIAAALHTSSYKMTFLYLLVIAIHLCDLQFIDGSCLPCICCHDEEYGGSRVDCSSINLTHVPQDLPSNTTTLYLNYNKITRLKTGEFSQLTELHKLELSHSNIYNIENDSFTGLGNLEILRLDGNSLTSLEGDYGVFDNLDRLKVLFINRTGIRSPGRQLSKLTTLQQLYVDCSNCSFTTEFSKLIALSNLTLDSCDLTTLNQLIFVNVPYLKSLSLQDCNIEHIEPDTFLPLKHLQILDLSYNWYLGLKGIANCSRGLMYSDIQVLKLNSVTSFKSPIGPVDGSLFQYLTKSKLRELHADRNVISYISRDATDTFPDEIELLSVRYTILGDFIAENLTGIVMLKNLRTFDSTGLTQWDPRAGNRHSINLPKTLLLPPRLQIIKLPNHFVHTDVGKLNFFPPNILTEIYISENFITSFIGPVTGVESVKHFDASNNILSVIGGQFFPENNSMTILNISNNNLGNCFEDDSSGSIFSYCNVMEVLDISNNRIKSLPKRIFKGLRSILYLNISKNEMFTMNLALSHMKSLRLLDLSNNKLQLLSVDVRNDLDVLNQAVVNLEDNPLACSCQSLEFLQWIRGRQGRIQGLGNMTCVLPDGTRTTLIDLDKTVTELDEQCSSKYGLIVLSTSLTTLVGTVVVAILSYRHRWKLRYLMVYLFGRRGYSRVQNADKEENYRYDAFVSYADEDRGFVINCMIPELEEKAGLKLCIYHRDFMPGLNWVENSFASIRNSRKAVIVLSPSFLKSDCCTYEFNMARVDGLARKQNTIVTVLYEQVMLKDAPKDVAVMLSTNSYLEYNADMYGGLAFWQNLIEVIKTPPHLH